MEGYVLCAEGGEGAGEVGVFGFGDIVGVGVGVGVGGEGACLESFGANGDDFVFLVLWLRE